MQINRVRFWRRVYLLFSMSLGVLSPLICWYMIPDFNPIEKPLSYFGVAEITAWYWNLSLIMISLAIYLNAKKSLPIYFKKLKTLRILRILLTVLQKDLLPKRLFLRHQEQVYQKVLVTMKLLYSINLQENLFFYYREKQRI